MIEEQEQLISYEDWRRVIFSKQVREEEEKKKKKKNEEKQMIKKKKCKFQSCSRDIFRILLFVRKFSLALSLSYFGGRFLLWWKEKQRGKEKRKFEPFPQGLRILFRIDWILIWHFFLLLFFLMFYSQFFHIFLFIYLSFSSFFFFTLPVWNFIFLFCILDIFKFILVLIFFYQKKFEKGREREGVGEGGKVSWNCQN